MVGHEHGGQVVVVDIVDIVVVVWVGVGPVPVYAVVVTSSRSFTCRQYLFGVVPSATKNLSKFMSDKVYTR